MGQKLFFIFNPKSGKAQIKSKLIDIIDVFVKGGFEVRVHPTQAVHDAYNQVKELDQETDLIVCAGGDGTLDEVVTGLMESGRQIPLGYIPGGSTNDFASSLAIPKDMIQAAHAVVEGHCYPCDVGGFNQDTFVYIAAFGLFTDVSYQTDQALKNVLGHVAYILEGMKRIFEIQSYLLQVEANGSVMEHEYIFGMITNSRSVGGFKKLTGKHVELDDGLFEVTLIRMPKNPLELNEIITSLLSGDDTTQFIDSFKTNEITLDGWEDIPWTLDGEFGGNHRCAHIINRKHAIEILLNPQKEDDQLPLLGGE